MERLYLPVILGTTRQGRQSVHPARLVTERLGKHPLVETELLDLRDLPIPVDDVGTDAGRAELSEILERADGLVLVVPEYNHGYPGVLKQVLDSHLKEYIHKPVGLVGVSAGPFGGTRVIENLLPVMRELGLVTIFWDVNFSEVGEAFDEAGRLLDEAYLSRLDRFIGELIWMATTLRYGRRQVSTE